MNLLLAATVLIILHNVDGVEIIINVQQIVALQSTNEGGARGTPRPNELIASGHRCVVSLTNGKVVSVKETCEAVAKAMEGTK